MVPMADIRAKLALNLKHFRGLKDWTQSDLAEASGYSAENIKKLETQMVWVSDVGLERLSSSLGVSPADMFGGAHITHEPSAEEALDALTRAVETLRKFQKLQARNPGLLEMIEALPALNDSDLAGIRSFLEGFAAGMASPASDVSEAQALNPKQRGR